MNKVLRDRSFWTGSLGCLVTLLLAGALGGVRDQAPSAVTASIGAVGTAARLIPFQAYLTDADGRPVTGSRHLRFRLFNVPEGGVPLSGWVEDHPTPVSKGLALVTLGGTPFPAGISFDQPLYLQVEVDGAALLPRHILLPAVFAAAAERAEIAGRADQATEAEQAAIAGQAQHASKADFAQRAGRIEAKYLFQARGENQVDPPGGIAPGDENSVVAFTEVLDNPPGGYDGISTFTAPVDGFYFLSTHIQYYNGQRNGTDNLCIGFLVNGVTDTFQQCTGANTITDPAGSALSQSTSGILQLLQNDTVNVRLTSVGSQVFYQARSFSGFFLGD